MPRAQQRTTKSAPNVLPPTSARQGTGVRRAASLIGWPREIRHSRQKMRRDASHGARLARAARGDVGEVEAMERELLALWERHRELEAEDEAYQQECLDHMAEFRNTRIRDR